MNQHDESSSTDVVNAPGEADEEDGGNMVDNLLLKVLQRETCYSCGGMVIVKNIYTCVPFFKQVYVKGG